MRHVRAWATLKKLADITDLLFKLFAATAALAAINFFLQQPELILETRAQAFLDENVIQPLLPAQLAGLQPEKQGRAQEMLRSVILEYNRRNRTDLEEGRNTTLREASVGDVCAKAANDVAAVFGADCDDPSLTNARIGRGRYYERRLLLANAENGGLLNADVLKRVLQAFQAGEFRRARCFVDNAGNAKAINVTIRPSEGYFRSGQRANDPFSLRPEEKDFVREFETDRGALERDPKLQFDVDWTKTPRPESLNTTALVILGAIFGAIFLAFLANDIAGSKEVAQEEGR